MQAGRDANGDFTFSLFDKTGKGILIDATGVKPDAIADGLIVNKMVSDSANIAASKLDINSLFTEINNSSKVTSVSRIYLTTLWILSKTIVSRHCQMQKSTRMNVIS